MPSVLPDDRGRDRVLRRRPGACHSTGGAPRPLQAARPGGRAAAPMGPTPASAQDAARAALAALPPALKQRACDLDPGQRQAMRAVMAARGASDAFLAAFADRTRPDPVTGKAPLRFAALVTPGRTILYTSVLRRGAFGRFHRALDLSSGAEVALKVIRYVAAPRPPAAVATGGRPKPAVTPPATVVSELQIMRAVGSPLAASGVVTRHHKAYLLAPLYDGDLTGLAGGLRRFGDRAAVGVEAARAVGQQLARCHAAGYLHRDVKLENVLFSAGGAMVLGDYGLATPLDRVTGTARAGGGTLRYLPPEALVDAEITAAADVWSLGILFVALVVGAHPVSAQNAAELTTALVALLAARNRVARGADGQVDRAGLAALTTQPLARLAPLAYLDRRVATFVLDRMLVGRPSARASAAEVVDFFAAVAAAQGTAAQARAAIDAHLAGPAREAAAQERAGLIAYAHAHARSLRPGTPPPAPAP